MTGNARHAGTPAAAAHFQATQNFRDHYLRATEAVKGLKTAIPSMESGIHPLSATIIAYGQMLDTTMSHFKDMIACPIPPMDKENERTKFLALREGILHSATKIINTIMDEHGWLSTDTFGKEANTAALSLIIWADHAPEIIEKAASLAAQAPEKNDQLLYRELQAVAEVTRYNREQADDDISLPTPQPSAFLH